MHEWAWDVLLYWLWTWTGPPGIIVLKALVSGLIFVAMTALAMRRGAGALLALLAAALGTQAMCLWLNDRPQVLQPLFVLLALHLMQSHRQGNPRAMLWYPALMLAWVNFHGSFPFGLVVLVLFIGSECLRTPTFGLRRRLPTLAVPSGILALVLLLSVLACVVNPNGIRGALYPLDYVGGKLNWAVESVTEWKSPDWHHDYLRPLEFTLLLMILALAISPLSPTLFDLLLLLLGVHMLLQWGRNGALFATLALPVTALHLSAWLETAVFAGRRVEEEVERALQRGTLMVRLVPWVAVLTAVGGTLTQVPWRTDLAAQVTFSIYPVKAAEFIALNNLQGRMFNVYHWGGYLLWRFYGERLVFMDGRADVYGEKIWRDYRQVSLGGAGWKQTLDKYNIQIVLLDPDYAVCRAIDQSPDFTRVYQDRIACVYVRNKGPNADAVRRFRAGKLHQPHSDLPRVEAILW